MRGCSTEFPVSCSLKVHGSVQSGSRSVVGDRRYTERRNHALMTKQRLCGNCELVELVDHGLPFWGVPPDADPLVCDGFPGGFIDNDRVPPDLPLETRGCHRIVGQFLVIGMLTH